MTPEYKLKVQIKQMTNFQPIEVVGRGSETQLQVGENLYTWIWNKSSDKTNE